MSAEAWYLDTSAFLKLVRHEAETPAMLDWLPGRMLVSSDLIRTEARRAAAGEPALTELVDAVLATLAIIRLTPELFDGAGRLLPGGRVRSLDAVHLTAARALEDDLAGVVTYDGRMTEAAKSMRLDVVAPA